MIGKTFVVYNYISLANLEYQLCRKRFGYVITVPSFYILSLKFRSRELKFATVYLGFILGLSLEIFGKMFPFAFSVNCAP